MMFGSTLGHASKSAKAQLEGQRQRPGEARYGNAVFLDEHTILIDKDCADSRLLTRLRTLTLSSS
jgi:hypothetical protein